jgi:hypothetical protein
MSLVTEEVSNEQLIIEAIRRSKDARISFAEIQHKTNPWMTAAARKEALNHLLRANRVTITYTQFTWSRDAFEPRAGTEGVFSHPTWLKVLFLQAGASDRFYTSTRGRLLPQTETGEVILKNLKCYREYRLGYISYSS